MALYAAFANNLDPAAMALRAPNSPLVGTGWLRGWRLTFGGADLSWQGALPTVVEDPASAVFVSLYALTEPDQRGLDSAEGFDLGLYRRLHVRVSALAGDESAWLYALTGYEGGFPRREVLDRIVAAAIAAGAPADYVSELAARPSVD